MQTLTKQEKRFVQCMAKERFKVNHEIELFVSDPKVKAMNSEYDRLWKLIGDGLQVLQGDNYNPFFV